MRTVVLLASDTLNVNDVFLAVHLRNLAIAPRERSCHKQSALHPMRQYRADLQLDGKAREEKHVIDTADKHWLFTLYFFRNSSDRPELIRFLLSSDEAEKCALRSFLLLVLPGSKECQTRNSICWKC